MQLRLFTLLFAILSYKAFTQTVEPPLVTPPLPVVRHDPEFSTSGEFENVAVPSFVSPSIGGFFKDVVLDEKSILKSPARVEARDWSWLIPLAGTTAFLVASDERTMLDGIKTNAVAESRSRFVSDAGVGALAFIPAVVCWWGWRHGDDYAMDSGVLTVRARGANGRSMGAGPGNSLTLECLHRSRLCTRSPPGPLHPCWPGGIQAGCRRSGYTAWRPPSA